MTKLTAAHGDDNFQMISMNQHLFRELAARDDLAIALDSDALTLQCKVVHQLSHVNRRLELLRLSINGELYHER